MKNLSIIVSLSGFINYLDPRSPSKPVKVIAGHNKPITRMIKGHDDSNPTLISAGSDGRVVEWSVADGSTRTMQVCYLICFYLPYVRHYKPRLVHFYPIFHCSLYFRAVILKTIYVLKAEILQFLILKCTVYNQEWFQIKSGL